MQSLVDLEEVGVSLGGRPILRDINLDVGLGEAMGIAGPNGSGKTTLIRTLATLISIDNGHGRVLGADLDGGEVYSIRPRIGLIGHQPALIGELTLNENLTHVARLAGIDEGRVANALDVVGLGDVANRRADACSFGMQRRVEIAHLLLTRPHLVLLDEAASGLDTAARGLIAALIDTTRGRGGGAVVVSHDETQLRDLVDNVMTLDSGRLQGAR